MAAGPPTAGFGEIDRLLLRAALLEGGPARAAYDALRARLDLDSLDYGRQRLLPLLHRNLTRFGVDDPELGRLRGVRHYHWARNRVRIRSLVPLLDALRAAGIPSMLLKGAALLATCIEDMSLRPMDDVDVLVPYAQRAAAVEVLTRSGYQPLNAPAWCIADAMQALPGHAFVNAANNAVDLHWHVLHLDMRPDADEAFWRRSRAIGFGGAQTAVLDPADQALHVMSHGARWDEVATLRWAADAALILRAAGAPFAWDQLVSEAIARRLAPPIHAGLSALKTHLGLDIPAAAIAALAPRSRYFARIEHELRAAPEHGLSAPARLALEVMDHRRRQPGLMERPLVAALASFARARLGARGPASMLALVLYGALGRPRLLRRWLRPDWRAARSLDAARLPMLGAAIDPLCGPAASSSFLDGWSHPEHTGRWTNRREARLAWRLPEGWKGDLEGEIAGSALGSPRREPPLVDIRANDHLVASWYRDRGGVYRKQSRFRVPRAAIEGAPAVIVSVAAKRLASPAEIGLSRDPRRLGAFVRRIRIAPATAASGRLALPPAFSWPRRRFGARNARALAALTIFAALGRPRALRPWLCIDRWARHVDPARLPSIDDPFAPDPPEHADPFLDGWQPAETAGRWMAAGEARAAWALPAAFRGPIECEVAARVLAKPDLPPVTLTVWANDLRAVRMQAGRGGRRELGFRFPIPEAATREAEALVLGFVVDPLRSPAELGLSADARRLGLFLERIRFRRPPAPARPPDRGLGGDRVELPFDHGA